MLALTYQGSKNVRVERVPDPTLLADDDIILRVTATAICGSDLHIYRGKIPMMKDGDILGHEFMGVVEETGSAVTEVQRGDRVVIPFVIACGQCFYCNKSLFAACETSNPGRGAIMNKKHATAGAGLFGYSHLYGGYAGGQAEFVRVPKANVGPIKIPDVLQDEQVLFLSDILPTGYQAAVNADLGPGSSVAIFGAGPVGLMAAASARFLGAEQVFVIDHHPYRLQFARETYGATTVNFDEDDDAADTILKATSGHGVDATIDAVGFEAKGSALETAMTAIKLEGSSGKALRQCIAATRRGGVVSVRGGIRRLHPRLPIRRCLREGPDVQDGADARAAVHAGAAGAHRCRQAAPGDHHHASHAAGGRCARLRNLCEQGRGLPQGRPDALTDAHRHYSWPGLLPTTQSGPAAPTQRVRRQSFPLLWDLTYTHPCAVANRLSGHQR